MFCHTPMKKTWIKTLSKQIILYFIRLKNFQIYEIGGSTSFKSDQLKYWEKLK